MAPQNLVRMVKQLGIEMRQLIYKVSILTLIFIQGCDVSGNLIIQNYSKSDILLNVKTRGTINFEEIPSVDSLFKKKINTDLFSKYLPIVKDDTLQYHLTIPSNHAVLILPINMGPIRIEWVSFTMNNIRNTVYIYESKTTELPPNIKIKSTGFLWSRLVLSIN